MIISPRKNIFHIGLYTDTIFGECVYSSRWTSLRIWSTLRSWHESTTIGKHESSLISLTFTFCAESFDLFFTDIVVCFFSFKWRKTRYSYTFASTHGKWDFAFQKCKETLIFWFHIVIDFEMDVVVLSSRSFCDTTDNMLKWFEFFSVHPDKKRWIWCLYSYIEILTFFCNLDSLERDTEILEERCDFFLERHTRETDGGNYMRKSEKGKFFSSICK